MSCAVLTSLKLTGPWRSNCEFPYSHQICPHGWGKKGSHQASFPLSQASSTSLSAQPTGFHVSASPWNDSNKSIVSSHKNQGLPYPLFLSPNPLLVHPAPKYNLGGPWLHSVSSSPKLWVKVTEWPMLNWFFVYFLSHFYTVFLVSSFSYQKLSL